uniref:dermonecrotic toxin domain-containing protein n=1 Tax=Pseudomonas asplenii TaxID=53407 RepID=UPI000478379A
MTATISALATRADLDAASSRPPLDRHQAFIANRLPAPLKQPGSACLKPLADITPTTPAWYTQADAALRSAFDNSQLARCASQHALEDILGQITPLDSFATPLLQQAIRQTFGLELDVRGTYFVRRMNVRRPSSLGGLFDFAAGDHALRTWYWDVTLLEAALHNFTASEAAEAPNEGDEFITHDHNTADVWMAAYDKDRALPLAPEHFAALCRTLDLGQRYQTHLNAVLNPPDLEQKARIRQTWATHLHNQLAEAVHLARLRNSIPEDAYRMLGQWLAGRTDMRLDGHPVKPGCLRMLGVDLGDILFLRPEAGPSPRRCVVYIPGDDLHPVRHYASSADFMTDLRTRLHSARYRRFFAQFIAVRDQAAFFTALKKRLDPADRHEMWDDYRLDPELRVGLDLVEQSLRVGARPSLPTALKDQCELKIGRMLGDARALAVPTDDEDRAARMARFLGFLDATLELLNLLVFIPGVGQVALLAMGTRLLHEVYSGIEA